MIDEEGAGPVRAELDRLAAGAPPVSFTAADVVGRGRGRRQARRGAAIGGTAAALALVVAVPAVALRDGGTAGTGVAAGSSATPTPTSPTPAPAPAGLRVPGLTPAQADRIARACAVSYGRVDGPAVTPAPTSPGPAVTPMPTTPQPEITPSPVEGSPGVSPGPTGPGATPVPTASRPPVSPGRPAPTAAPTVPTPSPTPRGWDGGPRPQDDVRAYNRIEDAAGEHVLAYGPTDHVSCDREGTRWNAGGAGGLDTAWLPGPVAVDALVAAPGGPRRSGADAPGGPGYVLVEGRAARTVAWVTVAVGADRADVRTVNGTFLVRFVKSATWPANDVGPFAVTAYDRDGRALAGVSLNSKRGCWVDPAGQVVVGDRANSPAPCRPATPWR